MSTTSSARDESSDALLLQPNPSTKLPTPASPKKRIPRLDWGWEGGAVLVSLVCMSLIVAILCSMDGKPMRLWTLPIQPNSLVAVFSTITKSALLVPIAESIGQLKWDYFSKPRAVQHMQTFDQASRGPWGALVFLWKTRGTAILATFGSLITVLMLAFEPFTQQVIELHSRETVLYNTTGYVSSTKTFNFAELRGSNGGPTFPIELYRPMVIGILNAISKQQIQLQNHTYCPTLKCRVEDFASAAVCTSCESEDISLTRDSQNCSYDVQKKLDQSEPASYLSEEPTSASLLSNQSISGLTGNYSQFRTFVADAEEGSVLVRNCSFESAGGEPLTLRFRVIPELYSTIEEEGEVHILPIDETKVHTLRKRQTDWKHTMDLHYEYHGGETTVMGVPRNVWTSPRTTKNGTTAYDNLVLPDRISACAFESSWARDEFSNIALSNCFTTSSSLEHLGQLDHFGQVNGTMTKCQLRFCERRYQNISVGPNGMHAEHIQETGTVSRLIMPDLDESGVPREFDTLLGGPFTSFLYNTIRTEHFQYLLSSSLPSSETDWIDFFERISDVFTQTLQSPFNPNATRIYGDAYGPEIFVRVRWPWFIMPLSLVLASNILLCLTIYHSRKSRYLYKNSIMAILFHGLEGWEAHELLPVQQGRETHRDIMDTSERMVASLRRGKDGILKLKRA